MTKEGLVYPERSSRQFYEILEDIVFTRLNKDKMVGETCRLITYYLPLGICMEEWMVLYSDVGPILNHNDTTF